MGEFFLESVYTMCWGRNLESSVKRQQQSLMYLFVCRILRRPWLMWAVDQSPNGGPLPWTLWYVSSVVAAHTALHMSKQPLASDSVAVTHIMSVSCIVFTFVFCKKILIRNYLIINTIQFSACDQNITCCDEHWIESYGYMFRHSRVIQTFFVSVFI